MGDFINKALIGFKSEESVYGTKPNIPLFPTLEDAQSAALSANIKTLPQAQAMAGSINEFNRSQLESLTNKTFGAGAYGKITGNIASLASGEIPSDISAQIGRSSIAKGFAGGFGGSSLNRNLVARDLGLNSLQLMQQGIGAAERWLSQTPNFDVTSMFISPAQRYQASINTWNRDLLAAKVKAAPDPVAAGEVNTFWNAVGIAASVFGGSRGGGAGGSAAAPSADTAYNFGSGGFSNSGQSAGGYSGGGPSGGWSGGNNWYLNDSLYA